LKEGGAARLRTIFAAAGGRFASTRDYEQYTRIRKIVTTPKINLPGGIGRSRAPNPQDSIRPQTHQRLMCVSRRSMRVT